MDLSFFVIPKTLGLNGVQNYRRKINLRCKIVKNRCKIDYKSWKIVKKKVFLRFSLYYLSVFLYFFVCVHGSKKMKNEE